MWSSSLKLLIIPLFPFSSLICAAETPEFQLYITRPELRVPIINVTNYDEDKIYPGYTFFATWALWGRDPLVKSNTEICTFGPYIIDNYGNLIWSGACDFENRNALDFRIQSHEGKDYLTFGMLGPNFFDDDDDEIFGQGVMMNDSYQIEKIVEFGTAGRKFNGHEFQLVEDGKSALAIYSNDEDVSGSDLGIEGQITVKFNGFREIEIGTNKILFDWYAKDHLSLNETSMFIKEEKLKHGSVLDYVHMNSADKFSNGDYLISIRHMDTIFRIDGVTGDIIWRLGGKNSDFKLNDFKFMRQHDARVREEHGNGKVTISFLDNSSGLQSELVPPINQHSSGRIITIDENTWVAEQVIAIARPDGRHSYARGNLQYLSNGNYYLCWGAEDGKQSEHTSDGSLVQLTQFNPSYTYRTYKFNFTSHPHEIPVIRSFVYGSDQDSLVTSIYVSWNGATEVRSYNYYAVDENSTSITNDKKISDTRDDMKLIGNGIKDGFETLYMYSGYAFYVVAEALDADGKPLENGLSEIATTEVPTNWFHSGFNSESLPEPEVLMEEDKNYTGQSVVQETSGRASFFYFDIQPQPFGSLEIFCVFSAFVIVCCCIVKLAAMMKDWRSRPKC